MLNTRRLRCQKNVENSSENGRLRTPFSLWSSTCAEVDPKGVLKLTPSGAHVAPCWTETVHLDNVGPICKNCKLPSPVHFIGREAVHDWQIGPLVASAQQSTTHTHMTKYDVFYLFCLCCLSACPSSYPCAHMPTHHNPSIHLFDSHIHLPVLLSCKLLYLCLYT